MTRVLSTALALSAFLVCIAAAQKVAAVNPESWRVPLEGDLRQWVSVCDDSWTCPLILLVADAGDTDSQDIGEEERRWSLLRWSPSAAAPVRVRGPIAFDREPTLGRVNPASGATITLAADRRLWLIPVGDLDTPGDLGAPSFVDPGELRGSLHTDPSAGLFFSEAVGEFSIVDPDGNRAAYTTPVDVQRGPTALDLRSPRATPLGDGRWVIGPQAHGDLRLRSLVIDAHRPPDGGDESDDPNPVEMWSRLPAPERVVASQYEVFGDRVLLYATTLRADKIGVIEKKKMRVFELAPDRTRAGQGPIFEVLTSSRMWQELDIHLVDVDLDGLRDLVLLQPEGMGGGKLIVDVHRGLDGGGFEERNLRTVLPEVDEDTPKLYGHDWDDDDTPDLLVLADGQIRLYQGLPEPSRKKVLERDPVSVLRIDSDRQVRDLRPSAGRLVGRVSSPDGKGALLVVRIGTR